MSDYYVNDSAAAGTGSGTSADPWNWEDATDGTHTLAAGDRLFFKAGTYENEKETTPGYTWDKDYHVTGLLGTASLPIKVTPVTGEYVKIDGRFSLDGCAYVHIYGFHFHNTTAEPGSISAGSAPVELTDWGAVGVELLDAPGCKVYNNVIQGGAQCLSIWKGALDAEIYGNICFGQGWAGPDRNHGHPLYVQNDPGTGTKIIRHNIFGPGRHATDDTGHYAVHAYADSTEVSDISMSECLAMGAFFFYTESNPQRRISIKDCWISAVRVGSDSAQDGNGCSVGNNAFNDGELTFTGNTLFNAITRVANGIWDTIVMTNNQIWKTVSGWQFSDAGSPPAQVETESATFTDVSSGGGIDQAEVWANSFDTERAILVIADLDGDGAVDVSTAVDGFLNTGDTYTIQHFRDYYGTAVASGTWAGALTLDIVENIKFDGVSESSPVDGFVILRTSTPPEPEPTPAPPTTVSESQPERVLTSDMRAASQADTVAPILLYHASFPDVEVYGWTGYGDLSWNNQTWTGFGDLILIDPIQESADSAADSINITVNGLEGEFYTPALLGRYHGRPAQIWLGALDTETGYLLDSPTLLFGGFLDSDRVIDDGESAVIRLTLINDMSDELNARAWYYTHEDQKTLHPGTEDNAFEFVGLLQNIDIS